MKIRRRIQCWGWDFTEWVQKNFLGPRPLRFGHSPISARVVAQRHEFLARLREEGITEDEYYLRQVRENS